MAGMACLVLDVYVLSIRGPDLRLLFSAGKLLNNGLFSGARNGAPHEKITFFFSHFHYYINAHREKK